MSNRTAIVGKGFYRKWASVQVSRNRAGRKSLLPAQAMLPSRQPSSNRSWESDDDLDHSFSQELEKYAAPGRKQQAQHLELLWNITKRRKPETCSCCEGSGHQTCGFCNGTGAMTVGGQTFCNFDTGCKRCPVCKSKGAVDCHQCKGTGMRAGWLRPEAAK